MVYNALVKELNLHVEEEVTVVIEGVVLVCFVREWLNNVEVGKSYSVTIEGRILNDIYMVENEDASIGFKQIGNSFSYIISWRFDLATRSIDAGITICFDEDEVDFHDYAYLDGKNVSVKVDRLEISFMAPVG